jgi:hypothetical protein
MSTETLTTTRKIAINGCHGGFRLSEPAFVEFMRRKGLDVYAEAGALGSTYWQTPIDQQPQILRIPWYKVPEEQREEYERAAEAAGKIYEHDFISIEMRNDPDLIAVIEQFGDAAGSRVSKPRIVEIPADADWVIEEYDGLEWVAEKHRTWS